MAKKISELFVNIGAKTDDFKKGLNEVKGEGNKLSPAFKAIGGAIVGAFAVSKIVAFAGECAQLAQVAEGVEMAFKRIGDSSTLNELRKATKGTVNDLDLMKAAVQANNFGIPLQQLGKLLEFAHQRAKDTGQSVDYLVQSIVMGIGRKSPLILDNLGISAVALKAKMKGIGTETASVADVARAVGEIASDAMKGIGDSAETAAEKTARLNAEWDNAKIKIGKFVNSVLNPLKDALIDVVEGFRIIGKSREELEKEYAGKAAVKMMEDFKAIANQLDNFDARPVADQIKLVGEQIYIQSAIFNEQIKRMEDLKAELASLGIFQDKRRKKILDEIYVLNRNTEANKQFIYSLEDLEKQLKAKTLIPDIKPEIGLIESAKTKIEELRKQIEKAPSVTIASQFTNDLIKAERELENLQKQIRDSALGVPLATGLKPIEPIKGKVAGAPQTFEIPQDKLDQMANGYQEFGNKIESINMDISQNVQDFGASFAEGLGAALAGTMSVGDAFLGAMADFLGTLGKQMIAVGFAKTVLDKILLTPGGGLAAIAIGTTLVALAGAVRATMSAGIGGGGSTGGTSSGNYNNVGRQELTVYIEGVTKGSDIYWSQKNYNKRLDSTISR